MSCLKKKNKDEFHALTKETIKYCCFSGFLFEITTKMEVYSGKAKREEPGVPRCLDDTVKHQPFKCLALLGFALPLVS